MSVENSLSYARAGNGTRTRDPNLGKVVLYQLSYSRRSAFELDRDSNDTRTCSESSNFLCCGRGAGPSRGNGGEGNRTPDLVNAIHALSQLSYAPDDGRVRCEKGYRPEPRSIAVCISRVNEIGLAKSSTASILQRLRGRRRSRTAPQILRDLGLLTVEMRRIQDNRRRS